MLNDIKRNLLFGKVVKDLPHESKLLLYTAIEVADPSGLFDVSYPLDVYALPLTALTALENAGLLLYFRDENVAAIVHWNIIANQFQRGKGTLFPEVKSRLAVKNGKYSVKDGISGDTAA